MYFYEFYPKGKRKHTGGKNMHARCESERTQRKRLVVLSPKGNVSTAEPHLRKGIHSEMGQFPEKGIVEQCWFMINWLINFFPFLFLSLFLCLFPSIHTYPKRCPLQGTCDNLNFYFWNTATILNDLWTHI